MIGKRGLLFDTQAILSWAKGTVPRPVIERVREGDRVYISIVSFWEFVLKSRFHNMGLTFTDLAALVKALEGHVLGIEFSHLHTLRQLPSMEGHRDPFDRMIISQAIAEPLVLVGCDGRFPAYQKTQIGRGLTILWKSVRPSSV